MSFFTSTKIGCSENKHWLRSWLTPLNTSSCKPLHKNDPMGVGAIIVLQWVASTSDRGNPQFNTPMALVLGPLFIHHHKMVKMFVPCLSISA